MKNGSEAVLEAPIPQSEITSSALGGQSHAQAGMGLEAAWGMGGGDGATVVTLML